MSFARVIARGIDERFLDHRRRSTSLAGVVACLFCTGLFGWRFYVNDTLDWDLLAVSLAFVAVKVFVLAWYRLTD